MVSPFGLRIPLRDGPFTPAGHDRRGGHGHSQSSAPGVSRLGPVRIVVAGASGVVAAVPTGVGQPQGGSGDGQWPSGGRR